MPETISQAFQLGSLYEQLLKAVNPNIIATILAEAGEILGRVVTEEVTEKIFKKHYNNIVLELVGISQLQPKSHEYLGTLRQHNE